MLNLFKKKKIPDELPEIPEQDFVEEIKEKPEDKEIIKNHLNSKELTKSFEKISESNEKKISDKLEVEESFFTELQNNILKEIEDLNKLERWYNNKFLPADVVSEMRRYWESKKINPIIKIMQNGFREKIEEKIDSLQRLEKEWQEIYFNLIEKEEEIKDEERELKKILKEFIELCKRKKIKK